MYTHPTITAALAEQHRRDLMSQASAARQARIARQGSSRNPARRPLIIKALRTAAVASAIAVGAFLVTLAGPGHAPSASAHWSHFVGHGNAASANGKWYAHLYQATANWGTVHSWGTVNSLALVHRSQGDIRFAHYRTRWA